MTLCTFQKSPRCARSDKLAAYSYTTTTVVRPAMVNSLSCYSYNILDRLSRVISKDRLSDTNKRLKLRAQTI